MSNLAINDAGEVLAFDGKEWKPAPVAQNDKGDRMAFDGKEWRSLSDGKAAAKPSGGGSAIDAINTGVNWAGTQFTKGITGLLGGADTLGELGKKGAAYIGEKVGAPEVGKNVGAAFKSQMTFGGLVPSTEGMNNTIFGGAPGSSRPPATAFGVPLPQLGVPEVNAGDNPALTLTNPFGLDAKVNLGKMLDAGAQAIPGMMMLPAAPAAAALSPGARAATTAVPAMTGGIASEAAGQATSGTPWEIPARIGGGVFGALAGNRLVSPLPANLTPEQARTVALAKEMDIPLTVGQETGRLRGVESALARFPTSSGQFAANADRQATGINRAALKEAGAVGDRLDPETMKAVFTKASGEFEAAKRMPGSVKLTPDFYRTVEGTVDDYLSATPGSAVVPAVEKKLSDFKGLIEPPAPAPRLTARSVGPSIMDDSRFALPPQKPTLENITAAIDRAGTMAPQPGSIVSRAANQNPSTVLPSWMAETEKHIPKLRVPKGVPELSNEQYQEFRRSINTAAQSTSDSGARIALKGMRRALDDAMEASLASEKAEAWREVRKNWANLKILSKAAAGGSIESRSAGNLTPGGLSSALRQAQGPDRFATTQGGLNDVARVAGYLADSRPNSGTPTTQAFHGLISGGAGLGAAGLTGAGAFGALAPGVALPAAAALMTPNLIARAMTGSNGAGWLRNYLANQAAPAARGQIPAGARGVPFTLAPGVVVAAPRLENRQ